MSVRRVLKRVKVAVAIAGGAIVFLGLLGGASLVLSPFLYREQAPDPLQASVLAAACLVLGPGLGSALVWQALNSLRGRPSTRFRLWPSWLLFIIFILIVAFGQVILWTQFASAFFFPILHVLAITMPIAALVGFVGRKITTHVRCSARWRETILQLSSGAFLSTAMALPWEGVMLLSVAVLVLSFVTLVPGGPAWIKELIAHLRSPAWLEDPANAAQFILSPPVFILMALMFAVIAPMIEELCKTMGVVLMSYRRPSRAQAFLWGVAGGAGFALTEGLLSTAMTLESWGLVALMRVGTTVMHCLGGGLMGLGWYYCLVARRPWRLLGTYGLSVGLHSLWNVVASGLVLTSLLTIVSDLDQGFQGLASAMALALMIFLALQTLVMALVLYYLSYVVGANPEPLDAEPGENERVRGVSEVTKI